MIMDAFDSNAVASGLVITWIKAGALLALTWLIVRTALRRRSASMRHAAWLVGILAALALPVASVVLPEWRFLPVAEAAQPEFSALAIREVPRAAADGGGSDLVVLAEAKPPWSAPSWQTALVATWLAGALLLLIRIAVAWTRLAGMTRRSSRFETTLTELETRTSKEVTMPLVWGWLRPTILLPAGAETWPQSRLRSVLLHEAAHAARRDPLIQVSVEIARALLWMQPLIWIANRELRREREAACDDAVLASGVPPKTYATDLLDIISQQTDRIPAGALAMACPSTLETRVRGVLDNSRVRGRASSCWWALSAATALAVVAPLAMLTVEAQEPKATPESPRKVLPETQTLWLARGLVTDADGKPVAGVEITAFCGVGTLRRAGGATTDENGRYQLKFGPGWQGPDGVPMQAATIYASKPGFFELDLSRAGDCVAAGAVPDGFPQENNPWGVTREKLFVPGEAKELNFTMAPATSIKGRLVDAKGAVEGRNIWLTGPDLPPSTNSLAEATTDEEGRFEIDGLPAKFGYSLLIPNADNRRSGWSLGPMFFKSDTGSPVAFALAEKDAPILAEDLEIELAGAPSAEYEKRPSTRSVQAEGGASIRLSGANGGSGIRIGGPGGLRIQGQGAMRSKRLRITLGGAGGGGINLAP